MNICLLDDKIDTTDAGGVASLSDDLDQILDDHYSFKLIRIVIQEQVYCWFCILIFL